MNASQRRKFKRGHPYTVKLEARTGMRYFEHDFKVDDARKWCNKNTKGYRVDERWDYAMFKFTTEKDAVHFSLKWL